MQVLDPMDITPLGHSSFRIRGKSAVVVTDPFEPDAVGIKFPKNTSADIVTISHAHPDHNAAKLVEGSPYIISGPGEYEVKGVGVVGTMVYHDGNQGKDRGTNTIYRLEIDGLSIVHLGDLGHKLSSEQEEGLGVVDILFVPVGGFYTIDSEVAALVVNEIEPKIVIPMHYNRSELNQATFGKLQPLSVFLKEMGKESVQAVPKLSITKDKLPEEPQLVVLE